MPSKVVNRGLLRIGAQASQSTSYNVARYIRVMSVDDSSNAFGQTDTALNTGGAVSNMFDQALDGTPAETGTTIQHVCTYAAGDANFTIRRVALHDDTAATVTTSSVTLVAGQDGQAFLKTPDFALRIYFNLVYSNV